MVWGLCITKWGQRGLILQKQHAEVIDRGGLISTVNGIDIDQEVYSSEIRLMARYGLLDTLPEHLHCISLHHDILDKLDTQVNPCISPAWALP